MAKKLNICLHQFLRFFELTINCVGLGVLWGSALWLSDAIRDQVYLSQSDRDLLSMLIVNLVFATVTIFFHHLLVNLRFWVKTKSYTTGLIVYDAINCCACHCLLHCCCKDNCKRRMPMAIVKWMILMALATYTMFAVQEKKKEWEYEDLNFIHSSRGTTRFDLYIMLFAYQQLIWPIFHFMVWILFACCTCCVKEWDDEQPDPNNA